MIIDPNAPLSVITSSLSDGQVGAGYSAGLQATGGDAPYTWTIDAGSLPEGLSLSGSDIAGVPVAIGTFSFTVAVSDSSAPAKRDTRTMTITVAPGQLAVSVGTDRSSYRRNKTVLITVAVEQFSPELSGTVVSVKLSDSRGKVRYTARAAVDENGAASFQHKLSKKARRGEWSLTATATHAGYLPGSADTTFKVT